MGLFGLGREKEEKEIQNKEAQNTGLIKEQLGMDTAVELLKKC